MSALGKRYLRIVRHPQPDLTPGPAEWDDGELYENHVDAEVERPDWYACGCDLKHLTRIIAVDLDLAEQIDETENEREGRLERQLFKAAGELTILRDAQAGRAVDKSDQDYYVRGKRTAEIKERAAVEVRRLLEAFRPPDCVIETHQNRGPTPVPSTTWFGREHDDLLADPNTWFASMGRPLGDGAYDSQFYVMARTEHGALAKLLAHILDGGGFYPMT